MSATSSYVLLLGLPGSGKTTVGNEVARGVAGLVFSASESLRSHLRETPRKATRWQEYWSRGENAPDEEVLPVLWDQAQLLPATTVLLDGYPRTLAQLQDFCAREVRLPARCSSVSTRRLRSTG